MNNPANYDLPDHYAGDGLRSFKISLQYASGNPVNLEGAVVRMQLKTILNVLSYEFSSEMEGENKLTILEGGQVEFPAILTWDITSTKYYYDLRVTDAAGSKKTYLKGTWRVNQSITK